MTQRDLKRTWLQVKWYCYDRVLSICHGKQSYTQLRSALCSEVIPQSKPHRSALIHMSKSQIETSLNPLSVNKKTVTVMSYSIVNNPDYWDHTCTCLNMHLGSTTSLFLSLTSRPPQQTWDCTCMHVTTPPYSSKLSEDYRSEVNQAENIRNAAHLREGWGDPSSA